MTVTGHGIPRSIVEGATAVAHEFFSLPARAKLSAAPRRWNPDSANVYRGYFPSSVEGKEGLDVGDPDLDEPALLSRPYHERNALSVLGAEQREALGRYFAAGWGLASSLLRALVFALGGLPECVDAGFARPASLSTLRFNFYPTRQAPVTISAEDGAALSCEAHVDSGFLTLLHQDDRGGLQVRGADRRWHDVAPDADAFVVNTGLALQRMTGRALIATRHRVLHARRPRLSIPYFFEPIPDFVIDADSLALPFPRTESPIDYEHFLHESLAKFSEYDRPPSV